LTRFEIVDADCSHGTENQKIGGRGWV